MTLLITGAAGFLGSNLLVHMAAAHPDARIVAADLCWPANAAACTASSSQVKYVVLDVRSEDACNELMRQTRPTHVLHAAAITDGPGDLMFAVNVKGAANVLQAASCTGSVERGILLSSSAVYRQEGGSGCCDEDSPLDIKHPYASTKRRAELLIEDSRFVAARLAPLYGPHEQQSASRPRVSMVQRLLEAWREGREITVAGEGMQRDWTHVSDATRALDHLLFAATLGSTLYNVSSGVSVRARHVVAIFSAHGLRVREVEDPAEADFVLEPSASRKPLCCARLHRDAGFIPGFDIESGIADLIHAQERHL